MGRAIGGSRARRLEQFRGAITVIILFGLVSLLADVVYEGARSVSGPYLEYLGGPILAAGILASGEILSDVFKLVGGFIGSRRPTASSLFALMGLGYLVSIVSMPLLAFADSWVEALALYMADRAGKGLRAPARNALIASVSGGVGYGKAFAVHEVLDQVGGLAGPLLVFAFLSMGGYYAAFLALAGPGALSLSLILVTYRLYRAAAPPTPPRGGVRGGGLGVYLAFTLTASLGFIQWPILSYHYSYSIEDEYIALYYSVAMVSDAVAALVAGHLLDTYGLRSLILLPAASSLVFVALISEPQGITPLAGAVAWGFAMGLFESSSKAGVAVVYRGRGLAGAYGLYGFVRGAGLAASGIIVAGLYGDSGPLALYIIAMNAAAAGIALLAFKGLGGRAASPGK